MGDEFVCPICLNVMIEPVTLPCNHHLCKACLESTLTEASLLCPICRYRLSVWVRRTRKRGTLINEEKWRKIKELFPNYVTEKLAGNSTVELTEAEENIIRKSQPEEPFQPPLAAPGDLRREYEAELAREDAERAREEAASLTLIRELEEEERELRSSRQSILEADAELAQKLASSPVATPNPVLSRRCSWLDRFMAENQRLQSGAGSADSIEPELAPQFKPIETFPLSPNKSGSGTTSRGPCSDAGRDGPLRPRARSTIAAKENLRSPGITRRKTRFGGVTKSKQNRKAKNTIGTSEGTAFRPVNCRNRNIIEMMKQTTQEEEDKKMAEELQKQFDTEHRYRLNALRCAGTDEAYPLRNRRDSEPR